MIHVPPSKCKPVLELISVRAFGCFMPDQLATTVAVLTEAQGWVVDHHVDYQGRVMIVADHEVSEQTFVLSGTTTCIELAQLHADALEACGTFGKIEAALDAIGQRASRERSDTPTRG